MPWVAMPSASPARASALTLTRRSVMNRRTLRVSWVKGPEPIRGVVEARVDKSDLLRYADWVDRKKESQGEPMAHIRLRKFNTKVTYPEQRLDNDLCMVVRAGNHIFLRGQVGQDLKGNTVGIGDPRKQAE